MNDDANVDRALIHEAFDVCPNSCCGGRLREAQRHVVEILPALLAAHDALAEGRRLKQELADTIRAANTAPRMTVAHGEAVKDAEKAWIRWERRWLNAAPQEASARCEQCKDESAVKKCESCGKAIGGRCGACHCSNDLVRRGNDLHRLLSFAAPSFCEMHCGNQHRELCREMRDTLSDTKEPNHER